MQRLWHLLEPLRGYLWLGQKPYGKCVAYANGLNLYPNDEDAQPVQWIVDYPTKQWGAGPSWKLDQVEYPHEEYYLKLDCFKAKVRLNWQSRSYLAHTL